MKRQIISIKYTVNLKKLKRILKNWFKGKNVTFLENSWLVFMEQFRVSLDDLLDRCGIIQSAEVT